MYWAWGDFTCLSASGKRFLNYFDHSVQVFKNLVVPKTQDTVATRFQIRGAFFIIIFLVEMLRTVHFDDKFFLDATKIGDIRANGVSLAPPARAGVRKARALA